MSSALSSAESDAKKGFVSAWTPQTRQTQAGVPATPSQDLLSASTCFIIVDLYIKFDFIQTLLYITLRLLTNGAITYNSFY